MQRRLVLTGLACCLFFSGNAAASENERYRAIPTAPNGFVLIIDTKEGHLWTWNNNGVGETDAMGVNPRIRYQGNVRKNMKTPASKPKPSADTPADAQPASPPSRF